MLAINKSNIIIICGGNILQNETSYRSLIYYHEIIKLSHKKRKIIYFVSSGFGRVYGGLANKILKYDISSSDFCGARTRYDLSFAKKFKNDVHLMPDICFLLKEGKKQDEHTSFAYIPSLNNKISINELLYIRKYRNLEPIAVILFKDKDYRICKELEENEISWVAPENFESFAKIIKNCAFTINERLHGAIFSIICHTPAYITENSQKNSALLAEIKARTDSAILRAYHPYDIIQKKEIGVQDSDFDYVIQSLREDINKTLNYLFN